MCKVISALIAVLAVQAFVSLASAQQAEKVYRVGFLTAVSVKPLKSRLNAFKDELNVLGYVEGKNLVMVERYANGQRKRLPALATEMLGLDPDVIVVHGDSIARIADAAAKKVGKVVPIVLGVSSDPVASGIVASLAKPGGNITGVSSLSRELVGKRLQLIKEVVPSASRIAVFWNPRVPPTVRKLAELKAKAHDLGMSLVPVEFTKRDVDRAFSAVQKVRPDVLHILQWGLVDPHHRQIAEFALKNRLPTIAGSQRSVLVGGLMSYSVDGAALYRRAAVYVDKILKGASPADLPISQATKFNLTVNLKTAKALGIAFPRSILLRADKVIE